MTKYISFSTLRDYWHCRRKYELAHIQKLVPMTTDVKLAEGRILHQVLESYYRTGKEFPEANDILNREWAAYADTLKVNGKWRDELQVKFQILESVVAGYYKFYFPEDLNEWDFEEIEERIEIDVGNDWVITGRIDGLAKNKKTGVRTLWEHKYKTDDDEEIMHLDFQVSIYTLAKLAGGHGLLPTLYNVILKPQLRMAKKDDGKPELFKGRLQEAIAKEPFRFFSRKMYSRNRETLQISLDQIRATLREIDEGKWYPTRNVGPACVWGCSFLDICLKADESLLEYRFKHKGYCKTCEKHQSVPIKSQNWENSLLAAGYRKFEFENAWECLECVNKTKKLSI